jgi:putative DNA primase/helicase
MGAAERPMRSTGEAAIRLAVVNAAEAGDDDKGGGSRDLRLAKKLLNDSGNGERFRLRHVWTGSYWSAELGDQEWALRAQKTAHAIMFREAAALDAAAKDDPSIDAKRLFAFREFAVSSGNATRLNAMQSVSEPHLRVRVRELDANPFLFNVQNGTLELGSKADPFAVRNRRHARLDRITRISPVGYDKEATCPLFRAFLDEIMPDREVQDWLQRWFGYGLTGDYSEHKFAVHYGEGANGKGTLTKTMQWVLGDYGAVVQFQSFIAAGQKSGGEPSPDLAKLTGVRGVFASEGKKGGRLDDGLIKQLSGGDPATVRKLHGDFFDLAPSFKINLIANNKPVVRDETHGMWRRVVLIPYLVIVPDDRVDKTLGERLKAEGPGILNWCLDGWRGWRERGLTAPQAILAATAEYRGESDDIGQFLAAATETDPNGSVVSTQLYACYLGWSRELDLRQITQNKFSRELTNRGYPGEKQGTGQNRVMWRTGLRWSNAAINREWRWEAL